MFFLLCQTLRRKVHCCTKYDSLCSRFVFCTEGGRAVSSLGVGSSCSCSCSCFFSCSCSCPSFPSTLLLSSPPPRPPVPPRLRHFLVRTRPPPTLDSLRSAFLRIFNASTYARYPPQPFSFLAMVDIDGDGLISYEEYMLFRTLLSLPQRKVNEQLKKKTRAREKKRPLFPRPWADSCVWH